DERANNAADKTTNDVKQREKQDGNDREAIASLWCEEHGDEHERHYHEAKQRVNDCEHFAGLERGEFLYSNFHTVCSGVGNLPNVKDEPHGSLARGVLFLRRSFRKQ